MTVDPLSLKGRDFLLTADWTREELETALEWSFRLKEMRRR